MYLKTLGGSVIDQQSSQHVHRYGSVKTGCACVTDAGNLPCKKVIHTVGPIYKGGIDAINLLWKLAFPWLNVGYNKEVMNINNVYDY